VPGHPRKATEQPLPGVAHGITRLGVALTLDSVLLGLEDEALPNVTDDGTNALLPVRPAGYAQDTECGIAPRRGTDAGQGAGRPRGRCVAQRHRRRSRRLAGCAASRLHCGHGQPTACTLHPQGSGILLQGQAQRLSISLALGPWQGKGRHWLTADCILSHRPRLALAAAAHSVSNAGVTSPSQPLAWWPTPLADPWHKMQCSNLWQL
jgi:hypothetical protein